jgi:hypothetical protein
LLEFLSNTGIVLSVIFVLLSLIYLLILFILLLRIAEQFREGKQKNFLNRWEEKIFQYLSENQNPQSVLELFPKSSYKYLLQNLRTYLFSLKGNDWIKLSKLINETSLYDYLLSQLKSRRKKKLVFGAYYLGLAKAENSKYVLKRKLKHRNEIVFLTCALSLARMNEVEAFDDILNEASKFKHLSQDTMLSVIVEYDESVCEHILIRLDSEKSLETKALLISALRYFKYSPAAPIILPILLKEESIDIVIESLKFFGEIEYRNAATAIRFYLINPRAEIKTEAIKAAVKIGESTLEDRIWSLVYDNDRNVKITAAEAMYGYSEDSNAKLKELAYSRPSTIESSVARMIISEKTIHLN